MMIQIPIEKQARSQRSSRVNMFKVRVRKVGCADNPMTDKPWHLALFVLRTTALRITRLDI